MTTKQPPHKPTPTEVQQLTQALQRARTERNRSTETHLSEDEMARQLGLGVVELFLLWMAKADIFVVHKCPNSAKKSLLTLGGLVAFTSMAAFASSWYTISTLFLPDSYLIATILAALYAFAIMMIDREIASAITPSDDVFKMGFQFSLRMGLAILVGLTVSYPIKLKVFEPELNTQIEKIVNEQHAELGAKRAELEKELAAGRDKQVGLLGEQFKSAQEDVKRFQERAEREDKQRGGCGPKCQAAQQSQAAAEEKLKKLQHNIENSSKEQGPERITSEIAKIDGELKEYLRQGERGLLMKGLASDRLANDKTNGRAYSTFQNFILALFMALELIPMLIKYSMGKSEYNIYLEARQALNVQKMISITNYYMTVLKSGEAALLAQVPTEITDILHDYMEDEASPPESERQPPMPFLDQPEGAATESPRSEGAPQPPTGPARARSNGGAPQEEIETPIRVAQGEPTSNVDDTVDERIPRT